MVYLRAYIQWYKMHVQRWLTGEWLESEFNADRLLNRLTWRLVHVTTVYNRRDRVMLNDNRQYAVAAAWFASTTVAEVSSWLPYTVVHWASYSSVSGRAHSCLVQLCLFCKLIRSVLTVILMQPRTLLRMSVTTDLADCGCKYIGQDNVQTLTTYQLVVFFMLRMKCNRLLWSTS